MAPFRFVLNAGRGKLRFARSWPLLTLAVATAALGQAPASSPAVPVCKPSADAAPAALAYVRATQVDMTNLLAPPPAEGSEAARRDLAAVLEAQRIARAQHLREHAIADATTSCGRFDDVLGAALTSPGAASVLTFLNRSAREGSAMSGPPKQYWHRRRPYAIDARVERLADVAANAPLETTMRSACGPNAQLPSRELAAQALARVSYPSGHATFGTVCAILLADMVPEKRRELFARAQDYAHSRLIVGAHFPSDLEAGRIVGTTAVALMHENAQFQHDFAAARTELRAALGLPAAPPAGSEATLH
jgi:acid phosphatase (class A)